MPTTAQPGRRPQVYLAGPEVFLPDAVALGDRKRAICQAHGFEASFPLDRLPEVEDRSPADIARQIFAICTDMMDGCDLLVANVTPFRGVSADVGTAIEVGYMLGRGKPVFAYSTVEAHYDRRVRDAAAGGTPPAPAKVPPTPSTFISLGTGWVLQRVRPADSDATGDEAGGPGAGHPTRAGAGTTPATPAGPSTTELCATLQQALRFLTDRRDTQYETLASRQTQSVWLAMLALALIVIAAVASGRPLGGGRWRGLTAVAVPGRRHTASVSPWLPTSTSTGAGTTTSGCRGGCAARR